MTGRRYSMDLPELLSTVPPIFPDWSRDWDIEEAEFRAEVPGDVAFAIDNFSQDSPVTIGWDGACWGVEDRLRVVAAQHLDHDRIPVVDYRTRWPKLGETITVDGVRHTASDEWLNPWHALKLSAAELWLPPAWNEFHDAVLVSTRLTPDGGEVAWVDRDIAEIVYLANQLLAAPPVFSCEGGPVGAGLDVDLQRGDERAWLNFHRGAHSFMSVINAKTLDGVEADRNRRSWLPVGRRWTAVWIPREHLPEVAGRLQTEHARHVTARRATRGGE